MTLAFGFRHPQTFSLIRDPDDCVDLLDCVKCIANVKKLTTDVKRLRDHASEGSPRHESAAEILHCLSRLLAYHQAVKSFLSAYQEWPELFANPTALHIPSSVPMKNPLGKKSYSAAAEDIIGRMTNDPDVMRTYRQFAHDMQKFDINERIKYQCGRSSFTPMIHAEILVHDWITRRGNAQNFTFFNDWRYIGTSKPPCRLCSYYIEAAGENIATRPTHNNIYLNWKLPDAQGVSAMESKKWQDTLNKMTARIRNDAFQIILDKTAPGKKHDSNTYDIRSKGSTMASSVLGRGDFEARMDSLGNTLASRLTLRPGLHAEDDDDDQLGGVSLLARV